MVLLLFNFMVQFTSVKFAKCYERSKYFIHIYINTITCLLY